MQSKYAISNILFTLLYLVMGIKINEIIIGTEIENIYDDCADVYVRLNDDYTYARDITTPKHLLSLMKANNQQFIEPGENFIIVEKLTQEVITKAIEAFVKEKDAYWLKLHHVSYHFKVETLNNIRDEIINNDNS